VIVDDSGQKVVDKISIAQQAESRLKSNAFKHRYEVHKGNNSKALGIFKNIKKFFETESIEITRESHLPINLFHYRFTRPSKQEHIKKAKHSFQEKFWSTIWCCYRQNFHPLLSADEVELNKAYQIRPWTRKITLGFDNDSGWGCTIRVTQMMMCHSILRATLGDYTLKKLGSSDEYLQVLTLINDNIDGRDGAFSIQNVVRMGLIFDKHPGEWHGNKSISLVFSHLNKIYNPIANFEVCLFGDESVYFDKVEKCAQRQTRNWLKDQK